MSSPSESLHRVPDTEDEAVTGVPGVPKWSGVYALVLTVFVLLLLGMTWFARHFA